MLKVCSVKIILALKKEKNEKKINRDNSNNYEP